MDYIRKADQRGVANFGWLNSKHSFSFGNYYDPKHMGVSVLRVINDDIVQGGAGFGMHGHRDMEIISYVIDGALEHKDNQGNEYRVNAGEIQRMSAGTGVMHSEYNASKTDDVHFLQIWITPKTNGIAPGYEQKTIVQNGPLTAIVTPDSHRETESDASKNSISMHQDASISRLILAQGESFSLEPNFGQGYLHMIKGEITGELSTGEVVLGPGDAVAPSKNTAFNVTATVPVEALWFDLPLNEQSAVN